MDTTYKEAIRLALSDALASDKSVFLLGEDVAAAGGAFKATTGLFEDFGPDRVLDTPISEQAIIGVALGAAIKGLRPVAEIMFADFAGVCFDGIANQMAKYRYMTGGQVTVPATVRLANGAGNGFGAQHSQAVENWFLNVPGLKIVAPSTTEDAYGLLRSAIADDDPVLFFEHKGLYNNKGSLAEHRPWVPLGVAQIVRPGADVTIVATQLMRVRAEAAAKELEDKGIDAEVIDPRTLVPMDIESIGASLQRTHNLVVVQECPVMGSWGASLVSALSIDRFEQFDRPPVVVSAPDTPIPYAGELEEAWIPSTARIIHAVTTLLGS